MAWNASSEICAFCKEQPAGAFGYYCSENCSNQAEEVDGFLSSAVPGDQGEPRAKRPKKESMIIEELQVRMTAALEGTNNLKSQLNTFTQVLLKRPISKADVIFTSNNGSPDEISLEIPALDFWAAHAHDGSSPFDQQARKQAEQDLARAAINELLERIQRGELTIPDSAIPEVGNRVKTEDSHTPDRSTDYKSQLNSALQKLLGKPVRKEDRVISFDMESCIASMEIVFLEPPLRVECGFDPDSVSGGTESGGSGLSREAKVARSGIEHQLAHLVLKELVATKLLCFDPSASNANMYKLGPAAQGLAFQDVSAEDGNRQVAGTDPSADQKSQLNLSLQKLLGRPVRKEDRVFSLDMDSCIAALDITCWEPPIRAECSFDPDCLKGDGSGPNASKHARSSVEHQLAQLVLEELVATGYLLFAPDASAHHLYKLGQAAEGVAVQGSTNAAVDGKAALNWLQQFHDSWQGVCGDEYSEQYCCKAAGKGKSMTWIATIVLQAAYVTAGVRVQVQGKGSHRLQAKEAVAKALVAQVEPHGLKRSLPVSAGKAPAPQFRPIGSKGASKAAAGQLWPSACKGKDKAKGTGKDVRQPLHPRQPAVVQRPAAQRPAAQRPASAATTHFGQRSGVQASYRPLRPRTPAVGIGKGKGGHW